MNEKIIVVDKELCDKLQALSVEVNSRKELIAFMINTGMDTASKQFDRYQKEYSEFFKEYETQKRTVETDYVIPNIGTKASHWNLDFNTRELTITY